MKPRYRRQSKLYLLDELKEEISEDYGLTEIEEAFLFSHTGGTTANKLLRILECRLITYQQQTYKDTK
jgi:hypothetical protein